MTGIFPVAALFAWWPAVFLRRAWLRCLLISRPICCDSPSAEPSLSVLLLGIPPAAPITAHTPLRHVVSADGQTVERSGVAVAALLPKPGRAAAVTLVLPPQALSWHRVVWPKVALRDRARARAVLHGLLEEQLLDDGAQLHMALAPDVRPGAATWVAVCDQAWLQGAVEVLAQAGVPVHRMVPV